MSVALLRIVKGSRGLVFWTEWREPDLLRSFRTVFRDTNSGVSCRERSELPVFCTAPGSWLPTAMPFERSGLHRTRITVFFRTSAADVLNGGKSVVEPLVMTIVLGRRTPVDDKQDEEIKAEDIVQLNSGGPDMTVTGIGSRDGVR